MWAVQAQLILHSLHGVYGLWATVAGLWIDMCMSCCGSGCWLGRWPWRTWRAWEMRRETEGSGLEQNVDRKGGEPASRRSSVLWLVGKQGEVGTALEQAGHLMVHMLSNERL